MKNWEVPILHDYTHQQYCLTVAIFMCFRSKENKQLPPDPIYEKPNITTLPDPSLHLRSYYGNVHWGPRSSITRSSTYVVQDRFFFHKSRSCNCASIILGPVRGETSWYTLFVFARKYYRKVT